MKTILATKNSREIPDDAYMDTIYGPKNEEIVLPWDADIKGDGKGNIILKGLPLPGGGTSAHMSCIVEIPYDIFNRGVDFSIDTDDESILNKLKESGWEISGE